MLAIAGQFATDFSPLVSVLTRLQGASMSSPPIRAGMERAGESYLNGMDARFAAMEAGGWRSLSRRTVRQRIRQGFPGPQPILRRIGELRGGLQRGAPGNRFEVLGDRVRVGYGGGAVHSPYPGQKRATATIAEVAAYHQFGTSRTPRRTILEPPDPAGEQAIASAVAAAVRELLQAA